MSADFRVTVTIRNGRLWRAIQNAGFDTMAAFCRAFGLRYLEISGFLSLRRAPYNSKGEMRHAAEQLCDALCVDVSELFPPSFLEKALTKNTVTVEMSEEQVLSIMATPVLTPEDILLTSERSGQLRALVSTLPPKTNYVISRRYGLGEDAPESVEEIAASLGLSRGRIHQIEAGALRLLKSATITKPEFRGLDA